jgi:hypothetical protein
MEPGTQSFPNWGWQWQVQGSSPHMPLLNSAVKPSSTSPRWLDQTCRAGAGGVWFDVSRAASAVAVA